MAVITTRPDFPAIIYHKTGIGLEKSETVSIVRDAVHEKNRICRTSELNGSFNRIMLVMRGIPAGNKNMADTRRPMALIKRRRR